MKLTASLKRKTAVHVLRNKLLKQEINNHIKH
jgi:hypothetical protein